MSELEDEFETIAEPEAEDTAEVVEEATSEVDEKADDKVAEEPKAEEKPKMVPLATYLDERDKRQSLERRVQQPPTVVEPAPDFYDDPQKAVQHEIKPIQQAMMQSKLETSRFMAERDFGKELVDKAFSYFNDHPQESNELLAHPSPFHAAVEAFNRNTVAMEIGDPVKYKEALEAEIRAKIQAEQVTEQIKGKPAPSLANETSIGGRPAVAPTLTPLDDILG